MAVIGFFPQKTEDGNLIFGLYTQSENGMYIARFWITRLVAIVWLPVQYLLFELLKTNRTRFYKAAISGVCIISKLYGNVFIASGRTHSYDVNDIMINALIEGEVDIDDQSEFRIEV